MASEDEPTVGELMEKEVVSIGLNTNVYECASRMSKKELSCAVILGAEGGPLGIVTEHDLAVKVIADGLEPSKVLVRDIMSTPLITISQEAKMSAAAELMSEYMVRKLVVLDRAGRLVGIITAADLAKVLAKQHDYKEAALNALGRVRGEPTGGPYQ